MSKVELLVCIGSSSKVELLVCSGSRGSKLHLKVSHITQQFAWGLKSHGHSNPVVSGLVRSVVLDPGLDYKSRKTTFLTFECDNWLTIEQPNLQI